MSYLYSNETKNKQMPSQVQQTAGLRTPSHISDLMLPRLRPAGGDPWCTE